MSSTNRGKERNKFDYYVTPQKDIINFLKVFKGNHNELNNIENVLDPCAGGDKDNDMSYPEAIKKVFPVWNIETLDIRMDSKANFKGVNYLDTDISKILPDYNADIIFTNPPFNLAMDFVKKAMCDVSENGYVIMLLRLNFLGSKDRNIWLRNNMPYEIYVHSKRMSFTKDGGTDSVEYAHFVWKKGYKGITRLHLLEFK
ncbi:hypothetical protein CWE04_11450 [Thomasclavelia cocleata]|uniref:DNA methyltransferase n=1 Tax=Thomasclavelia cocleata TaxID=69824 RepID=A0A1I0GF73_9FIRM|nr:hypothetical protein [Thomasclavelia cocleata]MCR1959857.1 hypothetical protein [Thomasclavelia cocleata]NDO43207.1 hypothetical protein [Thomasclavelia cocleata]PJN79820.1 hypothetical protein CWE04_11450 [Thomasclavelia cocleata]SET68783.1 hypothetical protein SAMN04489758_12833 [Thomasclavelia cocleata]